LRITDVFGRELIYTYNPLKTAALALVDSRKLLLSLSGTLNRPFKPAVLNISSYLLATLDSDVITLQNSLSQTASH
jgi:hypothetical protein